jgi:lactate 2-monooxygenase
LTEKHGKGIEQDLQTAAVDWTRIIVSGLNHGWGVLKFLRQHWDGTIVLKGIQTVADARRVVEAGMQGIVVSNNIPMITTCHMRTT